MKTAVIFYSLDGNCALAAEEIKTQLNADMIRLQTKDEKKRSGFAKFFWGGGMVFLHRKPPLKPYTFDPAAYDLIIIGAPIWAASPAPPIKTFLSETNITGKKIALFVCQAGSNEGALDKFKSMLPGNEIVAAIDFISPANSGGEELKLKVAEWLKGFI